MTSPSFASTIVYIPTLDMLSSWITKACAAPLYEFSSYKAWRRENIAEYSQKEYEDISAQLIKDTNLTPLQWCSWLIHGISWPRYDDVNKIIEIEPYVKTWIEHSVTRQWCIDELEDLARKYVEPKWGLSELKNLWIMDDIYKKNKPPHDVNLLNTYLTRIAAVKHLGNSHEHLKYKGAALIRYLGILDILDSYDYSNELKWSAWMAFTQRGLGLVKSVADSSLLMTKDGAPSIVDELFENVSEDHKEWWRNDATSTWYTSTSFWDEDPFIIRGQPMVMLWAEHQQTLEIMHALNPRSLRNAAQVKEFIQQAELPAFDIRSITFE